MHQKNALAVIPAFNEEKNITRVLEKLKTCCPGLDALVVDDGSTDETSATAEQFGIPTISLCSNMGYGLAVKTGLKYALRKGYQYVVLLDADGQHDPKDANKLLDKVKSGECDVAIGSRFAGTSGYRPPLARLIGIKIFAEMINLSLENKLSDITSGYQALNRKAIKFLSEEYPTEFPDADVLLKLSLYGFTLKEVGVSMQARLHGQSMINYYAVIRYPFQMLLAILCEYLRFLMRKEKCH